jgi:hypothetical protein
LKIFVAGSSKDLRRSSRSRNGLRISVRPRHNPTAGATVIGARMPLIAYNINLATDRLDVAKSIAKNHPLQQRRLPVREGDGRFTRRSRYRPGVDESDELREDADAPRVRGCQGGSREIRRSDISKARSWASSLPRRSPNRRSGFCSWPASHRIRFWRPD